MDKLAEQHKKLLRVNDLKKIGNTGSEASTYLLNHNNKEYAIKKFLKKQPKHIYKEACFQKIGYILGISPKVYSVNQNNIVMDKMDKNFLEYLRENNAQIPEPLQYRIIDIFSKLDHAGVYHNDPNPCNFMFKNNNLYIIDYGYSKLITKKLIQKHDTPFVNIKFMILGLILRIRELFNDNTINYKILSKKINNIFKNFR